MANKNVTENRHKYIGGSDVPIIMGISSFKSRFDLLLEKAELQDDDFCGNEYTEYGNALEPKIRDYINSSMHRYFKEDTLTKDNFRGNFDGIDLDGILEIKTTSNIKKTLNGYKNYLVQLLFYMQLAEKEKGILAVYERPKDFNEEFDENNLVTFDVNKCDHLELIDGIENAVNKFLSDLTKVRKNPFITEQELQSNELVSISYKLVKLELALAEYDEIKKQRDDFKAKLKVAMEKENVKKWTTNNGTQITLVADGADTTVKKFNRSLLETEKSDKFNNYCHEETVIVFDEETFKTAEPSLYDKYTEEIIKKGRSGYLKITLPKVK